MSEPVWLEEEDCLSFHEKLLARFGGAVGLRDRGLLLSALARPRSLLAYKRPTIFDLAAAYAHGIIRNHPFVDGNKRSGLLAAALFLEANGFRLEATEESALLKTLQLAAGELTAADYAAWLSATAMPVAEHESGR